ncbi:unnamed protein product [Tilletia controversa]|nr:unnamed protein product [Tilletia controversa]
MSFSVVKYKQARTCRLDPYHEIASQRWVGSPQPLLNDDQHSSMSLTQHRCMLELLHREERSAVAMAVDIAFWQLAAAGFDHGPFTLRVHLKSITFGVPTNGMVSKDIRDDRIFSHGISACPDPNSSINQACPDAC